MNSKFLGVDMMFDKDLSLKIVEVQTFTDFPDINKFNLSKYMFENSKLFKIEYFKSKK